MSENYIVINGKRLELTPEQLAALGVENPKESKRSPFERVDYGEEYYFIDAYGEVECEVDLLSGYDDSIYAATNYCTDESLMKQRALHEILNRRLWRYSMEHEAGKIDWRDPHSNKYYIYTIGSTNNFVVESIKFRYNFGSVYFYTQKTAEAAIEKIVKPFIKEHPEFVW